MKLHRYLFSFWWCVTDDSMRHTWKCPHTLSWLIQSHCSWFFFDGFFLAILVRNFSHPLLLAFGRFPRLCTPLLLSGYRYVWYTFATAKYTITWYVHVNYYKFDSWRLVVHLLRGSSKLVHSYPTLVVDKSTERRNRESAYQPLFLPIPSIKCVQTEPVGSQVCLLVCFFYSGRGLFGFLQKRSWSSTAYVSTQKLNSPIVTRNLVVLSSYHCDVRSKLIRGSLLYNLRLSCCRNIFTLL